MTEADRLDQLIARTRNLPHDAAVREVHEYFRSLPDEVAWDLAERAPTKVGPLEGAPFRLRYDANRTLLLDGHRQLQTAVENGEASWAQRKRLATIKEMLRPVPKGLDVDAAGRRIEVFGPRQFLLVDLEGQGRMIEVLGDLDKARRIGVLVPGMNNDLERVRAQVDRAQDIRNHSGPDSATVVWGGYHAPLGLTEGRSTESALAAAPLLCRFQAGLHLLTAEDAESTVVGNSYGAQAVFRAMREGMRASRIHLTGGPGGDPTVHSLAGLTEGDTLVFAARAKGDYVSFAQQHGPDLADFVEVIRVRTDNADTSIRGHMSYFQNGSESMWNVGDIVRGNLDAVTLAARTTPAEESRVLGMAWAGALQKLAQSDAAVPIAKVFDGLAALRTAVTPPRKIKPFDPAWKHGGSTVHRPDGPAR